jgi:catechol 2,3-dioxygenase-like lactoylglutathione lyase family enzyme
LPIIRALGTREKYYMEWNPLVPELVVNDYAISKKFYTEIFGFNLSFERAEDNFGYFDLDGAQIMLLQSPGADIYQINCAGPNGKGLHFQVELESISELLTRLQVASIPLASKLTEEWYRVGEIAHGQREFFVADPDGYLYRFFEYIGECAA